MRGLAASLARGLALVLATSLIALGADYAAHRFSSRLASAVLDKVTPSLEILVAVVALAVLLSLVGDIRAAVRQVSARPRRAARLSADLYVVQSGDTLWSIAGDVLGSPKRWLEIAALNVGARLPSGDVLTDPSRLVAGMTIVLPKGAWDAPRFVADPPPPPVSMRDVVGSLGAFRRPPPQRAIPKADLIETEQSAPGTSEVPFSPPPSEIGAVLLEKLRRAESEAAAKSAGQEADSILVSDGNDGEVDDSAPAEDAVVDLETLDPLDAWLAEPREVPWHSGPDDKAGVPDAEGLAIAPGLGEVDDGGPGAVGVVLSAPDDVRADPEDGASEEGVASQAGIDDQASGVDVGLLNDVVGWCNGPQAERLALALRLAGPEMARTAKTPIGAKIGTLSVELLFEQDVTVTEDDPPPEPWAAWPGMGSWVLTSDVSVGAIASASSYPSPFPALVPVGFDQNGLLLVNLDAYKSVAITHDEAPTYLAAAQALLGPVIRAPWADGVTILGNLPTTSDDLIVQVTASAQDISTSADCAFAMDRSPEISLVLADDGSCLSETWRSLRSRPLSPPKKIAGHLAINVLGPLVMSGHVESQLMHKGLELVAMLALKGGKMPVATAIDVLYDHQRVARSSKSRLLRSTAAALGVAPSGTERFRVEGDLLVLDDVGCDWADFEANLAKSKEACFASLRGRPLEDVTSQWARDARFDISHRIVEASLDIASSAIDEGRLSSAEDVLERARRAAPFSDDLLSLVLDVAALRGAGELEHAWKDIVAQSGTGNENAVSPALGAKLHALRSTVTATR